MLVSSCQEYIHKLEILGESTSEGHRRVTVLYRALEGAGHKPEIQCLEECDPSLNAKACYIPDLRTIQICCDAINSSDQLTYAVLHELIHAYDHLVRGWDMHDCNSIACTEIRANRNAECRDKWIKAKCVREYATEAVKTPCPDAASFLVNMNYKACMRDNMPFEEA